MMLHFFFYLFLCNIKKVHIFTFFKEKEKSQFNFVMHIFYERCKTHKKYKIFIYITCLCNERKKKISHRIHISMT